MPLLTRRSFLTASGASVAGIGAYSVNDSDETENRSSSDETDAAGDRSADAVSASTTPRLTLDAPEEEFVVTGDTTKVEFTVRNDGDAPFDGAVALRFLEGLPAELELHDRFGDGATWEPQSTPGAEAAEFVWQPDVFDDGAFAPGQRLTPELGFYAPASTELGTCSFTAALVYSEDFDQETVTIIVRD